MEAAAELQPSRTGPLVDRFGRVHTYLRVSVTDRCNYRCTYCMPVQGMPWLPRTHLLSYEEITRIVRVMAGMGIDKVRLTGGEPTLRRDLVQLVEQIAHIPGIRDLAMTTNGHAFARKAEALARAGLKRVNISIDAIEPARFRELTRGGDVARVLESIETAVRLELTPVKLNCVVVAGENEDQVQEMIDAFAAYGDQVHLRFIEYMPFDGNGRRRAHVPVATLRDAIGERYGLTPSGSRSGGPARNWQLDSGLVVGFISPMTEHFCATCNRLRLQADGHLRTCLSIEGTPSLRDLIRNGSDDAELEDEIRHRVWGKVAGHEAYKDGAFEGVMTSLGG